MGIVAYCPNRHRIKVKDELAGRKGICPECGVRFRIPRESQPEPPVPILAPASPAPAPVPQPEIEPATGLPVAEIVSFDAAVAATLPRALPLADDA